MHKALYQGHSIDGETCFVFEVHISIGDPAAPSDWGMDGRGAGRR